MIEGPVRQGETSHRRAGARLPASSQRVALAPAPLRSLAAVLILSGALSPAFSRAEADFSSPPQGGVTIRDASEPAMPAVQDAVDDPAEVPSDEKRRENLAQVLLMLLAGVGLMGAAMIAATMIWGAKLRRTARLPESGPTQQDELWYLKSPPPANDGPEQGGQRPDDRSDSPTTDGETAS